MRTTVKIVSALALGACISCATAGEKASEKAPAKPKATTSKAAKAPAEQMQVLTGSYIPRKLEVAGRTAVTTANPLFVVDNETIRRSGAHDLADLLRRGGWVR